MFLEGDSARSTWKHLEHPEVVADINLRII